MARAISGSHQSTKGKVVNLPMHPELHKTIRLAAIAADMNYAEWMHLHLIEFFGRSDLPLESVDLSRGPKRPGGKK